VGRCRHGPCGARLPSGADVRPGLDALRVRRVHDLADVSKKPGFLGGLLARLGKPGNTSGPPKNPRTAKNPPPPKGKPKT